MGCSLHPNAPRAAHGSKCRECANAKKRAWWAANPEKTKGYNARHTGEKQQIPQVAHVPPFGLCFCGRALPPPGVDGERVWFCDPACRRACIAFGFGRIEAVMR